MAPSFQEPLNEALEAPLKNKPDLVAPEPGSWSFAVSFESYDEANITQQNTAQVLNPNKPDKATPAMAAQIKPSAPLRPKALIPTSHSSPNAWLE
jgi:hypothetical protein